LEEVVANLKIGKESIEERKQNACSYKKSLGRFIIKEDKIYHDQPYQLRKRRYII